MTIRIEIPSDVEARLLERAAAEGKDPAVVALEAVQEKLGISNGAKSHSAESRSEAWHSFVGNMERWASQLPKPRRLEDSRESIYEGRGE